MTKCRFCAETGNHYVGGGAWLCFGHFLKLFARRTPSPPAAREEKP